MAERKGWMDILMGSEPLFVSRAQRTIERAIASVSEVTGLIRELPAELELETQQAAVDALMDLFTELGAKHNALMEAGGKSQRKDAAGLPLLKAWLMARAERKSFRLANGQDALTVSEIIKDAEYDCRDYLQIAERRPEWLDSVDGLVAEMRRAVTDENLSNWDDEDVAIVNDYDGAILNDYERSALIAQLNAMADECEARIRAVTMSMFERIGPPKGDRRRLARAQVPAPGAHKAYSGR